MRLLLILLLLAGMSGLAGGAGAQSRAGRALDRETAPPAAVPQFRRSLALVVGIDAYAGGWPRLRNAVADARAVAAALSARGFEVSLVLDPDSAALEAAFEDFVYLQGQDSDSRLLIWFAGHGQMIDGEAYLVPADAPGMQDAAAFRRRALSLRDFGKFMREARARHVLAIFDSCFSGNVFDTVRALPPAAIGRATGEPVRQMISSGDAGQMVSDDGSFRRLFLGALAGLEPAADANGDGYLTGSELGLFLADRVTNLTLGRQTPRYGKLRELGFDRGDFVFALDAAGDVAAGTDSGAAVEGRGVIVAPAAPPPAPGATPALAPVLPRPAPDPPDPAPAEAAPLPAPPAQQLLDLAGGETRVLMENRLILSMAGTPTGGSREHVAVVANGRAKALSAGETILATSPDQDCQLALAGIAEGQNRAQFLWRCGSPGSFAASRASLRLQVAGPPASIETFEMDGNSSVLALDGRLLFTMVGTPTGGSGEHVAVVANGEQAALSLGEAVLAAGADVTCDLALAAIRTGQNRAQFLLRCGAGDSWTPARAARSVQTGGLPRVLESFAMSGGASGILDPTGMLLVMRGTPFGGSGAHVGLVLEGREIALTVGEAVALRWPGADCSLTPTRLYPGENRADFLLRCF